jgi:hypothetical protein
MVTQALHTQLDIHVHATQTQLDTQTQALQTQSNASQMYDSGHGSQSLQVFSQELHWL